MGTPCRVRGSRPVNVPEPGHTPTMDGFVTDYVSTLTAELGRQPTCEGVARHGTEPATGAADLEGAWCWITSATPVARADRIAASGRDSSIRSCSGVIVV